MNARGRPGSRPPHKSGSNPETQTNSTGPSSLGGTEEATFWSACWPLNLDLYSYREAVTNTAQCGSLSWLEAKALISVAEQVGTTQGDIVSAFHSMLLELAAATTPERARMLAFWTPFAPAALEREARTRAPIGAPT